MRMKKMESEILQRLRSATGLLDLKVIDSRGKLPMNPNGTKYRNRVVSSIKGVGLHQELGWGTVEQTAQYHCGPSQLSEKGMEGISYTWAIDLDGTIHLCHDFSKRTWSQGTSRIPGDENADWMAVMVAGKFRAMGVLGPDAGEPTFNQLLAFMVLWKVLKDGFKWTDYDIRGHFDFGKASCPGTTLSTMIKAIRWNRGTDTGKLNTWKARQEALIKLGWLKAGQADGILGSKTIMALQNYQMRVHLQPDGLWGPLTEAKMLASLSD